MVSFVFMHTFYAKTRVFVFTTTFSSFDMVCYNIHKIKKEQRISFSLNVCTYQQSKQEKVVFHYMLDFSELRVSIDCNVTIRTEQCPVHIPHTGHTYGPWLCPAYSTACPAPKACFLG